jgi:hypothetical protein
LKVRFFGQPIGYHKAVKNKRREAPRMGDLIVMLGLLLYVPMSVVYVIRGRD